MKTTTTALVYATLVLALFAVQGLFLACCLVSSECRKIRRELAAEGECIDPARPILARLDVLHAELFGSDDE